MVNQQQQNSSPECKVFEIDSNGQEKQGCWDMREVKLEQHIDAKEVLMREFGVSRKQAQSSQHSLNHSDLRRKLADAIENCDEVALGRAIEKARNLGRDFEWQEELEEAESHLLMLACGDGEPEAQM